MFVYQKGGNSKQELASSMEMMALSEEQAVYITTDTIKIFYQISIPIYHNDIINQFPTCHIFQPSKINLDVIHQAGVSQFYPMKKLRKSTNVFRKICPHSNRTPGSKAR